MNDLPLIVFSVVILCICSPIKSSSFENERQISAYQPGHVIFGGLFPAHLSWREYCADLNMKGIALVEAMIYAVNRVNAESLLPWNIKLGFDIRDTCNVKEIALKNTLGFLRSRGRYTSINENLSGCGNRNKTSTLCGGKLVSIIGAGNTELSIAVNKVLSVFDIPQVGYASTSGILSDKSRFPSFSRTVVVGSQRPQIVAKILAHFGWNHIALVVTDSIHWKSLSLEFKNLASEHGICIATDELLVPEGSQEIRESIIKRLNATNIVLLFTSPLDTTNIIKQANAAQLTGKVWISTDMLSREVTTDHADVMQGMLAIEREPESVNEFANYFANLNPIVNTWNPWFKKLWEKIFSCRFPKDVKTDNPRRNAKSICRGDEKFGWVSQVLSFSHAIHVIDAVMAATQVIKNVCEEPQQKHANASNGRDRCLQKLTKANILKQMFKGPFIFQSLFNRTVSLDKRGDAISSYDVFNLKQDKDGVRFHKVGTYRSPEDKLYINNDIIQWPNKSDVQPLGTCGTLCERGSYREFEGSKCCWECKLCASGTYSKESNAVKCIHCPAGSTSNEQSTSCTKKSPEFFGWGSSGGRTLSAISLISFFLSFITFCVLLKYKTSAVVSGWGSHVNFYLLCSISIGVLVPFAFIGYPTDIMCKLQAVLVGTTMTLSISLVLIKIKQITCKKKYMISRWRVLSYAQQQTIFALFLTITELLLCVLWVIISPPKASMINVNAQETIIMCTNQNSSWYVLSFTFIFSITLVITFRSCKARDRSFNFSEAKYILCAMFSIYTVWGVYIAVFFGTSFGLHNITLLCLTIVATQIILLGFIFVPKVFILFWKPEMRKDCEFQTEDTKDHMNVNVTYPRYLHPNGMLGSGSPSFRDDSSMGSPSQVSLDLPASRPHSRSKSPTRKPRSILDQLTQLPCWARFTRDDDDSVSSIASDQHLSYQPSPSPRRLPVIMIDAGTRSNSTKSQLSDPTSTPRFDLNAHPTRHSRTPLSIDREQDLVSATMDHDTSEVWTKRRLTPNHNNNTTRYHEYKNILVHQSRQLDPIRGEYYSRMALNGRVVERKNHRNHPLKDVQLRESRL